MGGCMDTRTLARSATRTRSASSPSTAGCVCLGWSAQASWTFSGCGRKPCSRRPATLARRRSPTRVAADRGGSSRWRRVTRRCIMRLRFMVPARISVPALVCHSRRHTSTQMLCTPGRRTSRPTSSARGCVLTSLSTARGFRSCRRRFRCRRCFLRTSDPESRFGGPGQMVITRVYYLAVLAGVCVGGPGPLR